MALKYRRNMQRGVFRARGIEKERRNPKTWRDNEIESAHEKGSRKKVDEERWQREGGEKGGDRTGGEDSGEKTLHTQGTIMADRAACVVVVVCYVRNSRGTSMANRES